MRTRPLSFVVAASLRLALAPPVFPQDAGPGSRNVIAVTIDGVRWQEIFGGASRALLSHEAGGVRDTAWISATWWRPTAAARREALLPFLWGTVVRQGQILGDSAAGSVMRVTNGRRFSYPGYNELLTGAPDHRIDSNDKVPNPNVTVLEWLDGRPAFRGRVVAYGSWDVLPFILNASRSRLVVNSDGPPVASPQTELDRALNQFAADLPVFWGDSRLDAVTMQGALHALRSLRPKVLYVLLGETDEWAHARRYDLYLDAAHRADRFLQRLWEWVQATPGYAGRTALIVSTDHGRGSGEKDWTDHGEEVPAADRIWMAVMGPDTPALGVRAGVPATQSQFAATLAALVGEDFGRTSPRVAPAIPGTVRSEK